MTLIDFINKYLGKNVDFDGVYGSQCVDLYRQYCRDVLEVGHTGAVEGAKDLYLKYETLKGEVAERDVFMRLSYFRTGLAREGDVAVWMATDKNPYGHVAIVLEDYGNNTMLVFEQNGFTQDGAKLKVRDKNTLLGYLRRWE